MNVDDNNTVNHRLYGSTRESVYQTLMSAQFKIQIVKVHTELEPANHESFPYIVLIVDEPQKCSPSNVLTFIVLFIEAS